MRILYLHQFFATPADSRGTRSYEFARRWVAAGHDVTMVCAARGDEPRRYAVEGIDVHEVRGGYADYTRATASSDRSRIAGFGGFAAASTRAAVGAARPDVVFATSPALTIAVPGILASRRHRAPLAFEVRDLWPRAPIEMGALSNPAARRAARLLERAAYRSSREVVALSPGMRDGVIAAGADPARVTMVPNAADLDVFSPEVDPGDLREEIGVSPDALLVSYFGTMGEANDLDQVLGAAAALEDSDVAFALQGDGKRRADVEAAITRGGLDHVQLLPAGDKASAARLAAASDACLTVFKDVPVLATNSPNKLFDTFAAGRAAVVNTDGWQRELVEDNDAGLAARPGDPGDLAAKLIELRDDRDRTAAMGRNARALAEARFDRDALADQLLGVLERAAGS